MTLLKSLRRLRRSVLISVAILCTGATLAACTVSVTGGVLGSLVTAVVWLALLVGTGATQPSCGPCLSFIPPDTYAPPPDVPDAGVEDVNVGPCLSQRFEPDVDVGPCLGRPLDPDVGPCLSFDPDVGPCLSTDVEPPQDVDLGPCLSAPPPEDAETPDTSPDARAEPPRGQGRAAVRERLIARGVLPADVADRLRKS